MNRFRSKKKGKDGAEGPNRPSLEDVPPVPKVSKTFRRKKQEEPEEKFELDLTNALPSSDDFRTSLLMNGLSARFSMLREQDDPNSKIGKASDDSVLFPTKRQSRLNGYNFQVQSQGLSDIAEVSSLNGSIRPPFASKPEDGYGTDDDSGYGGGSVMSRPKPGEGNVLFGGRQKIYKLNAGSGGATRGRALYDDDVSLSAFQKLRQREREQQEEQEEQERREQEQEREQQDQDDLDGDMSVQSSSRPGSPTLPGYNRKRETSSTTSSGGPSNARISTAATSITSQRTPSLSGSHTPITPNPLSTSSTFERTMTKGRRLYETGLDQHLHEQQNSAMNRLDNLSRRNLGTQTPPPGFTSPTETYQNRDVFNRPQVAGKASMPNLRTASPTPAGSSLGKSDFGVKRPGNIDTKPAHGIASPPLSPPIGEIEEHMVLKVQPNDRGKATALGAFQKPLQPYDENKYTQRQLQMQQGRGTPTERSRSPPRAFGSRQPAMGRARGESNAGYSSSRSRSNSSAQRQFMPQSRIAETPSPNGNRLSSEPDASRGGTFLSSPNESVVDLSNDREDQQNGLFHNEPAPGTSNGFPRSPQVTIERPPESEHPANRHEPFGPYSASNATSQDVSVSATESSNEKPPIDSPTLGPTTGLSGMIRQHLRGASNASSIYGNDSSSGFDYQFPSEPMPGNDSNSVTNTWEGEDWDDEFYDEKKFSLDNSAAGFTNVGISTKKDGQAEQSTDWEKELANHHQRTFSSETQKERAEFHNELAERRRRVQENLKSLVETETNKPASPSTSADWLRDGNQQHKNSTLDALKQKPSLGSLITKQKDGGSSKAMKMLGIGNATITTGTSPSKPKFDESGKEDDEEESSRSNTKHGISPQTKAFRQARREAQRAKEQESMMRHHPGRSLNPVNGHFPNASVQSAEWVKSESGWSRVKPVENLQRKVPATWVDDVPTTFQPRHSTRSPSRERKPPPLSGSFRNGATGSDSRSPSRAMARDRSGSDRHREETTSNSSLGGHDEHPATRPPARSPMTPGAQFQPSPSFPPVNVPTGRSRSNSKSPALGQSETDNLQPSAAGMPMDNGISPRPSPVAPFVLNPTPPQAMPPGNTDVRMPTGRKKSVNKSEISEPVFISSTSRVSTINLPPGASLHNGAEAPPIPPVNPRRRQTRTMFGAFGKKDEANHPMPSPSPEDMSTFSADEADHPATSRQNIRKISSEGAGLNARAHHETPTSAMPGYTPPSRSPPRVVEGGMF
ncbi:hypothetical protein B7463_g2698, partial [Scytalidium lignicola]